MSNGKKEESPGERREREAREQRDADRQSRSSEESRRNGGRGGPGGDNVKGVGLGDDDKSKREGKIGSINPAVLAAMERPTDTGDRECIQPANQNDKLWTADSKARWDDDQPSQQDLLKQSQKVEEDMAKAESRGR
jgi:hypothetical protein